MTSSLEALALRRASEERPELLLIPDLDEGIPDDRTTLRGYELAKLARRLTGLRARGRACYRCAVVFEVGQSRCPVHGETRPPAMARGRLRVLPSVSRRETAALRREAIGRVLVRLRASRGWSQEEAADHGRVHPNSLRGWELGRVEPRAVTLHRLLLEWGEDDTAFWDAWAAEIDSSMADGRARTVSA